MQTDLYADTAGSTHRPSVGFGLETTAGPNTTPLPRAAESPRDRALALTPFHAGARIAEVVRLDVDDVRLSARKGSVRLYGKGGKPREVEVHHELRQAYQAWLAERAAGPARTPAPRSSSTRGAGKGAVRGVCGRSVRLPMLRIDLVDDLQAVLRVPLLTYLDEAVLRYQLV